MRLLLILLFTLLAIILYTGVKGLEPDGREWTTENSSARQVFLGRCELNEVDSQVCNCIFDDLLQTYHVDGMDKISKVYARTGGIPKEASKAVDRCLAVQET